MTAKKISKLGEEAGKVKQDVRTLVLHEAGYKCANPRCRYPITLEVHHLHYVSEGGKDEPANLLPLCRNCHGEHHVGKIPSESLRSWKMLLLAINEAFDRPSVDKLLLIHKLKFIKHLKGEGVLSLAPLVASDLVGVRLMWQNADNQGGIEEMYIATLTEKGNLFVEGWLSGDQN